MRGLKEFCVCRNCLFSALEEIEGDNLVECKIDRGEPVNVLQTDKCSKGSWSISRNGVPLPVGLAILVYDEDVPSFDISDMPL